MGHHPTLELPAEIRGVATRLRVAFHVFQHRGDVRVLFFVEQRALTDCTVRHGLLHERRFVLGPACIAALVTRNRGVGAAVVVHLVGNDADGQCRPCIKLAESLGLVQVQLSHCVSAVVLVCLARCLGQLLSVDRVASSRERPLCAERHIEPRERRPGTMPTGVHTGRGCVQRRAPALPGLDTT